MQVDRRRSAPHELHQAPQRRGRMHPCQHRACMVGGRVMGQLDSNEPGDTARAWQKAAIAAQR